MCTKFAFTNRNIHRIREAATKKYGFDICIRETSVVCMALPFGNLKKIQPFFIPHFRTAVAAIVMSFICHRHYNLIGGCFYVRYLYASSFVYSGKINTKPEPSIRVHSAHMYLSRLFILFHFNIAIDVIAVVKICLLVSFSPLCEFAIHAYNCDVMSKCPRRKCSFEKKFHCFVTSEHSTSAIRKL